MVRRTYEIQLLLVSVVMTLFILACSGAAFAADVGSATGEVDASAGAVLRSAATTESSCVDILRNNSDLRITEEVFTTNSGTAEDTRWYKVSASGSKGYIRSDLVKNINYDDTEGKTTEALNLRDGAGTGMHVKSVIRKGSKVKILIKVRDKNNTGTWYKVKYGGETGYSAGNWIELTGGNTGGSSSQPKLSFSVSGVKSPAKLTSGKPYSISGIVSSTRTISKGEVRITTLAGKKVLSAEKTVNAGVFNVHDVDQNIRFAGLKAGKYRFKVILTVGGKKYTKVNKKFSIVKPAVSSTSKTGSSAKKQSSGSSGAKNSSAKKKSVKKKVNKSTKERTKKASVKKTGSTKTGKSVVKLAAASAADASVLRITCKDIVAPEKISEGMPFNIGGTITSTQKISSVRTEILNSKGTVVQSVERSAASKTYDIKDIDVYVKFGILSPGTYTYKVIVNVKGKDYTKIKRTFRINKAAKAKKIANKAFALAWPVGTSKGTYGYKGGKPTSAYAAALDQAYPDRSRWGVPPRAGASCDVFVGTVLRSCGVDPAAPRGLKEQFWYYDKSDKYVTVNYKGDRSVLKSGDIILYKVRGRSGAHTCIYLKKDGKEYIAEANYNSTYGITWTGENNMYIRTSLGNKSRLSVYRIKE